MEVVGNSIKCVQCKAVLECPVVLPCGDCVCKKHVQQQETINEFHCLACDTVHFIPAGGFIEIKALRTLLEAKIQKAKFTPEYTSACSSFKNLEQMIDELKHFKKDPYYLINKKIGELKSETDIIRDQFKLTIDQKADELIKELDDYEQECKSNLDSTDVTNRLEKISANVNMLKDELERWQRTLNCFDSDEAEWKEIQEKSEKYKNDLETKLAECVDEFLLKKMTEFKIKILSFCQVQMESDRK
jgi:DNA repair exonuclease SbcCD ATPase subunit